MPVRERRFDKHEIRATPDSRILKGHAVVWGALSSDLGGFKERFIRGAFSDFLNNGGDARALFNHDDAKILARQSAGTLKLYEDDIGLAYEIDVAQTSYGDDALVSVRRRDIQGMSFGFHIERGGERLLTEGGMNIREVTRAFLWEISPVTFPAYDASTVSVRSDPEVLDRFRMYKAATAPNEAMARYYASRRLELFERMFRKES